MATIEHLKAMRVERTAALDVRIAKAEAKAKALAKIKEGREALAGLRARIKGVKK